MGFWDRFRGLLRIGSRGPVLLPAGRGSDLRSDFTGTFAGGFILNRRGDPDLLKAFTEDIWLHSAVGRRGEVLAPVQFTIHQTMKGERARGALRRGAAALEKRKVKRRGRRAAVDELVAGGMIEEIFDHPALDLLENPLAPEPGMLGLTGMELWELTSNYMDLLGEALLIKERAGKNVVGLIPIPPTQLREAPIPTKPGYGFATLSGKPRRVDEKDVIWIRRRDPMNPLSGRGVGTARALQNEIELDEFMVQAARARYANGGMPEFILGLKNTNLSDEAFARFCDELDQKHRGPERAGGSHVLKGEYQAQNLGHTLVENQWNQARAFSRDTHLQGYGSPPEIAGVLSNSNKSTIGAAGTHMWRYSTMPMLERITARLQMDLIEADFGPDLILGYRSMEQTDEQREDDLVKALPSAFKKNEIRARAGEEPDPEGDVWYAQPGAGAMVPVKGADGQVVATEPAAENLDGNDGADPTTMEDSNADVPQT